MRTALLTLGRLPVALEIARALHADGWRVVVAEPLAWHLCRTSNAVARCRTVTAPTKDADRYLDELLRIVDEESVSLVVPVSEETMFVAALHGPLPTGVRLACTSQARLLELHDKWRFTERARALGLAVPETALASSEAGERIAARGAHVIKPRLSCSGVGVSFHDRGRALGGTERPLGEMERPLRETARPPSELDHSGGESGQSHGPFARRDDLVVQERLTGESCCAFALARAGEVRQLVVYRSLLESGSVSVTFERMAAPEDVRGFVESFVRGVGHEGMIAFDFIADGAGRHHAIECNPRATSGVHLLYPEVLAGALIATGRSPSDVPGASGEPNVPGECDETNVSDECDETNVSDEFTVSAESRVATPPEPVRETEGVRPVGTRRQEFWSALIEVEGALLRGRLDREGWRRLFATRDVNWSRRDPKPFLLMVFSGLPLVWRALRSRRPITEVTMLDVGWYE